jgi:hypothetical protein
MKYLHCIVVIFVVATAVQAQRAKSALLSASEAKNLTKQCSRPSPDDFTDTWEPTVDQIKMMEAQLKDIAKLAVKSCCAIGEQVRDPTEWYLQYAALVWRGKKIIYISGISRQKPIGPCFDKDGIITEESCEYWKYRADVVCDGGTSWGVIYDVSSGKFSDLAMNGVG